MLDESLVARLGRGLYDALSQRGFESLTPVQEAVLSPEHEGRDLRISSKTGSGKTVAIGLSVRSLLEGCDASKGPRVLVVVPTRELATQVEGELRWLFAPLGAGVASFTGGSGSLGYRRERQAIAERPAVIVGTPGRLLDHLDRGVLIADNLGAVVLDEADRMLDMGFRDDIEAIFERAPEGRRTHLVSATFPREVKSLADAVQDDPVHIQGTPLGTANEDIDHLVHLHLPEERLAAIINLLLTTPGDPVLIFAKMRTDVSQLTNDLRGAGFVVGKLSGEMDQTERNRALAAFKRAELDALVATDVAARGIDVHGIARVIHAEPPMDPDAYTHRSGRTGRAGNKGASSMLVTPAALFKAERLLARAKVPFRYEPLPSVEQIRTIQSERFLQTLSQPDEAPPKDELASLADAILALPDPKAALVKLLTKARALGSSEPRELTPVRPPQRRAPAATSASPTRERREPSARSEDQTFQTFRVSWGQQHGADARRLVAMVCRRGEIESRSIGAIRVARTYSTVEIDSEVAEHFAALAREPDPRDPRVLIRAFEDREEQPRPRPALEARPMPPPPRPSERGRSAWREETRQAVEAPRPSRPRAPFERDGGDRPRSFEPRSGFDTGRGAPRREQGAPPPDRSERKREEHREAASPRETRGWEQRPSFERPPPPHAAKKPRWSPDERARGKAERPRGEPATGGGAPRDRAAPPGGGPRRSGFGPPKKPFRR
jgi:ATP-dependent RNA helicase DeaD